MKAFVFFILFVVLASAFESSELCNGIVRDGISTDVDVQSSTSSVKASWSGFTGEKILRYEWAIVSSSLVPSTFGSNQCRNYQAFKGYPDVFGWQNAGTATSASATTRLVDGQKYFIIVRATNAIGQQFYSNSNGFTVDSFFTEQKEVKILTQNSRNTEETEKRCLNCNIQVREECPIDQAWKCQAATVSVRQYLDEFYGPPRFGVRTGFTAPVVVEVEDDDGNGDDDDTNIQGAGAFGIGAAICLFFLLLAIGIMLISAFGSQSDEFKTNVRRHDNAEEF